MATLFNFLLNFAIAVEIGALSALFVSFLEVWHDFELWFRGRNSDGL